MGQVIVFAATREDVDQLSFELGLCKIHGGMKQEEREIALKEVRACEEQNPRAGVSCLHF